jgi:hypothetical protein
MIPPAKGSSVFDVQLVPLIAREDILILRHQEFAITEASVDKGIQLAVDSMTFSLSNSLISAFGEPSDYNPFLFTRGEIRPSVRL